MRQSPSPGALKQKDWNIMVLSRPRTWTLTIAVVLTATIAFAQQKPFEPQVGQAGKDVVWVPSPEETVKKMMEMGEITPKDFVVDLGSGDGRNVIAAAKLGVKTKFIVRQEAHTDAR